MVLATFIGDYLLQWHFNFEINIDLVHWMRKGIMASWWMAIPFALMPKEWSKTLIAGKWTCWVWSSLLWRQALTKGKNMSAWWRLQSAHIMLVWYSTEGHPCRRHKTWLQHRYARNLIFLCCSSDTIKLRPGLRQLGVHPLIYVQLLEASLFPKLQPVRRPVHAERGKRATRGLNRCVNHT